jgi:rRNA processing protein Gar1
MQTVPNPESDSTLIYLEKRLIYNITHSLGNQNYKYNSVSPVRLLGVVQDISHDGKLIIKARFAPNPREAVRDNVKSEIGRVAKVFGPVRSPYVAIEPRDGLQTLAVLGKEVYVLEERDHGKGKRRN